jgi:hypothetical protein
MEKLAIPKTRSVGVSPVEDTYVFDVETLALPERVAEYGKPYPPFEEPKYGHTKDPVKRKARYTQKYKEWEEGKVAWGLKQIDKAALNPLTARVCAIGYVHPFATRENGEDNLWDYMKIDGLTAVGNHDLEEKAILKRFWDKFTTTSFTFGHCVGHNIEEFDLPFLMKRSWILGVAVSPVVKNGRYYHRTVVDTMKVWCNYGYNEMISLDKLGKILGVGEKPDYEAKKFAQDYLHDDRETAEFYLKNDLAVTLACYERLYKNDS